MLESLFSSRARARLIHLFYSVPGQEYWLREAARAVDMNVNAVRREVLRLEAAGILTGMKRGNQRVFRTNAGHPFFPELVSMVRKERFQEHQTSSRNIGGPENSTRSGGVSMSVRDDGPVCGGGFRAETADRRTRSGVCYRVE